MGTIIRTNLWNVMDVRLEDLEWIYKEETKTLMIVDNDQVCYTYMRMSDWVDDITIQELEHYAEIMIEMIQVNNNAIEKGRIKGRNQKLDEIYKVLELKK